jgi:hypothetical protein
MGCVSRNSNIQRKIAMLYILYYVLCVMTLLMRFPGVMVEDNGLSQDKNDVK